MTGQCSCKRNIDQRTCSQCKLGFHSFPNTTDGDCWPCDYCDPGGTTPDICEKNQGGSNYNLGNIVIKYIVQ